MPGIFSFASSRLGLCRTSHLLPGSPPRFPPVSRQAAPQPYGRRQLFTRPPLRRIRINMAYSVGGRASRRRTLVLQPHLAGEHVFSSQLPGEHWVLEPIFSGNAGSVAPPIRRPHVLLRTPPLHESLQDAGVAYVPSSLVYARFPQGSWSILSRCARTYVRIYVGT